MGRKAFGPSKKKACDLHHCKKKKQNKTKVAVRQESAMHLLDTRNI